MGRRALFGLGENDEGGRAPPQADWRLDSAILILVEEMERVRGGQPGRRRIIAGKALLGWLWLSDSRSHVIDECIRKDKRRMRTRVRAKKRYWVEDEGEETREGREVVAKVLVLRWARMYEERRACVKKKVSRISESGCARIAAAEVEVKV